MLSKKQRRQCLSLAENIALLSLLRRAPGAAKENQPLQSVVDDSSRILSFETEVRLTSTFAFLCGISDDPTHVIAACVEGLTDRRGIRVVVAINRERPASGNDVLERIKNGLEEMFRRLARANKEDHSQLEDRVLDAIVNMCKQRIFSRIQSRRQGAIYWKTGRAFLGSVIEQTLGAVRTHNKRKRFGSEVEGFIKNAVRLRDCLTRLENCQEKEVLAHIKDVLLAAHRVNKATDFDTVFQGFSPRDLNPSTQNGFELRLGKLANYLECARFLVQTAKSSRLLKGAEVKIVSLDENLFTRESGVPPECHLTACLSRCETGSSTPFGLKKVTSRLAELDRKNETFTSTIRKVLRESRVHAEVQIVCHYELHPPATKPRVICSSKDACYLCNLFIQLHGTFHIPRTHGNLYPGWRFLPLPTLNRVQAQLNKALEGRIKEVVGDLMTSKNPSLMLTLNENESTIFSLSKSLSAKAASVTLGEASGSEAIKPPEATQKDLHHGEDARRPEPSVGTRPTNNLCGLASPGPSIPAERRPASHRSRPDNPKLLSQEETPGSRPATPETCDGSAREAPSPVGEAAELVKAPSEYPTRNDGDCIPQRSVLGNEMKPEQRSEVVTGPESELEPEQAPDAKSEPGARTKPEDHERVPVPPSLPGSRPTSALSEPALIHEARPEPGVPRPNPESDLGGQQTSPEPFRCSEPGPKPRPAQIPDPEPNQAQDQQVISTPTPVSTLPPSPRSETRPRQLRLSRGQPLSLRLDDSTKSLPAITAGRITVLPEVIRSLKKQSRSVVEVRIHWLPRRRAAASYVARPRGFMDIEKLDHGVEIDGGSSECVYIAYKGEVVVVDVIRG